jgi:hypothetical protein
MREEEERLSDAELKEAREHSRRFGEWLSEGMNSNHRELPASKKPSPSEAA